MLVYHRRSLAIGRGVSCLAKLAQAKDLFNDIKELWYSFKSFMNPTCASAWWTYPAQFVRSLSLLTSGTIVVILGHHNCPGSPVNEVIGLWFSRRLDGEMFNMDWTIETSEGHIFNGNWNSNVKALRLRISSLQNFSTVPFVHGQYSWVKWWRPAQFFIQLFITSFLKWVTYRRLIFERYLTMKTVIVNHQQFTQYLQLETGKPTVETEVVFQDENVIHIIISWADIKEIEVENFVHIVSMKTVSHWLRDGIPGPHADKMQAWWDKRRDPFLDSYPRKIFSENIFWCIGSSVTSSANVAGDNKAKFKLICARRYPNSLIIILKIILAQLKTVGKILVAVLLYWNNPLSQSLSGCSVAVIGEYITAAIFPERAERYGLTAKQVNKSAQIFACPGRCFITLREAPSLRAQRIHLIAVRRFIPGLRRNGLNIWTRLVWFVYSDTSQEAVNWWIRVVDSTIENASISIVLQREEGPEKQPESKERGRESSTCTSRSLRSIGNC